MQFYRRHNTDKAVSPFMARFQPAFAIVVLALCCAPTLAETDLVCPQPAQPPVLSPAERAARAAADRNGPTQLWAQSMQSEKDDVTDLDGAAELIRGGNRVNADHLRYRKPTDIVEASGATQYHGSNGISYFTEALRLQLQPHIGEAGASRFTINVNNARGDANRVDFLGPQLTRLSDARYTTCREGQDDWFLRISRLDLDTAEDIGTARDATLDFFGVPIFYFPYLDFPLSNRRKSGFLFPLFGHSDNLGYVVSAPYYLNLAPNYDATLTPRVLSRRGLQLQNEFRYLEPGAKGHMELDVLPHDKVTGDDRVAAKFMHQQTFSPLWSGKIDTSYVSDKDYLRDFGNRIDVTSQTELPELAEAVYRGSSWTFAGRLSDHQTVDKSITPAERPYARLPQLQFASVGLPLPNIWYPQLETEWNRFQHDVLLTGERLNLNAGLSLPLQNQWGFLTPKVGARAISYHLDRNDDDTPALTRGVFSLDSGLFFERDSHWGGNAAIQTLEPRLFYLYVPKKNQDALPNFDSGIPDFSFAALFRENRFTGGDRIGDANQITAAVSTRFIDGEDGTERLRLNLGRIYYFTDQEVALPVGAQARNASDIVAEASAWLIDNWHVRETIQWNTQHDRVERNSFYLQYQPARNRILNLGQVYARDQIGQYDVSAEWPIAGRWAVRARSLYSTHDHHNIESYAGLEYNACCWALRVLASRRFQDPNQNNAILFEFELNGLSKLGSLPDSPLKQGLFTFKDELKENSMLE